MREAAERDDAMEVMAAPGSQPWADRLPGESVGEFKIFALYRNMPGRKRSITALAEQLGCKRGSLYRLSHQWKWGQRIAGYEAWLDRQVTARVLELHKKTAVKEAIAEYHVTNLLARNAARLDAKHAGDPKFIIPIGAHAQAADMTARQSRVGRGDVSERIEAKTDHMAEAIATLKSIADKRKAVRDDFAGQQ